MTDDTHASIHHDHRQWNSEMTSWRDDLRQWSSEVKAAQTLAQIGLQKHLALLESHGDAIQLGEQEVALHEHTLAEHQQAGDTATTPLDAPLLKAHHQRAAATEQLRQVHDQLKHRHHEIVTKLAALNRSLDIQSG